MDYWQGWWSSVVGELGFRMFDFFFSTRFDTSTYRVPCTKLDPGQSGGLDRLRVRGHPLLANLGCDHPNHLYATCFFHSKEDGSETSGRKVRCPERPVANIEGGECQNKAVGAKRNAVVAFSLAHVEEKVTLAMPMLCLTAAADSSQRDFHYA
jgi:hypothetical protein